MKVKGVPSGFYRHKIVGRGKYVGGRWMEMSVILIRFVMQIQWSESPVMKSHSPLAIGRGGGKKNTFTKENTSPDFRQKREGRGLLLCLLLLNCVHVHITFMSKQHIWGGIFWSHVVFIFPQHRTAVGWGHVFLSIPYWFPVEFWVQSRDPLLLSELKLEYSQL